MNLKINLITACLIFSWSVTLSQTHLLTLEDQQVELSTRAYNITKVIDERSDKTHIGWVQKGMVNAKVNANFTNPLEAEIRNFLNRNLVSNDIKPNIQIIIRTLKISEKTTFSKETGFCELAIDFLLEKDAQLFRILQTSLNLEIPGGMDVTRKHPQNIANAFKQCFEKLDLVDFSSPDFLLASSTEATIDEVPDSIKYNFPIFSEPIKTGIYTNYEALKNNTPSNLESFYLDNKKRTNEPWNGSVEVIPKFQDSDKKVKKVWAIAYEGQVYIYHVGEFFPLTIENFALYYHGYGIPDNQSIATGAMIGGLLGAGIASGSENAAAKRKMVKYYLDPNTGGFGKTILVREAKLD